MCIKNAKKFFWLAFILSAIFFIICAIIILSGYDYFSDMAIDRYHLSAEDFSRVFAYSMSLWKVLIFQFTLLPAIVLTIMDRKNKED